MRVVLDENVCSIDAESVNQAIAAASSLVEEQGRMIVEVVIDGQRWTGEDCPVLEAALPSTQEIRLTSADPIELIDQTFSDAIALLDDADQLQRSAGELLQTGQMRAGMEPLSQALTIWTSVQQALSMGAELAEVDLDQFHSRAGQPAAAAIQELEAHLRLIQEALKSRDIVALSDTLLFELPAIVEQWRELLADLNAHIQSGSRSVQSD